MMLEQRWSRWPGRSRSDLLPIVLFAMGMLCGLRAVADVHLAAAPGSAPSTATAPATAAAPAKKTVAHSQKEELYFARRYGIGELRVHSISAGASLEFRYRVLDADKAKALGDSRAVPVMTARKSGTNLSVLPPRK